MLEKLHSGTHVSDFFPETSVIYLLVIRLVFLTLEQTFPPGDGGLTWLSHSGDVHALFFSHEAQNCEDGEAGQETGGAVEEAQQERVPGDTKMPY